MIADKYATPTFDMMKWSYLLLILLMMSCQGTSREKQREGNGRAFLEYVDSLETIPLPFSMRCGLWPKHPTSNPPHSDKFGPSGWIVSGLVHEKPNLKVVLYGYPGDDVYPYLFSFDSSGHLIDSAIIYTGNCQADPWWRGMTYTTIHHDLQVTMIDTGAYYNWDETKDWEDRTFDKAFIHRKEIQMGTDGKFHVKIDTSKQLSLKELGDNSFWIP